MKSFNKKLPIFLYLVAALSIPPTSFAGDGGSDKVPTDIKNGDEIIIIDTIDSGLPLPIEDMKEPVKPQPINGGENKDNNSKPTTTSYDPKSADVNDKVNKKIKEEENKNTKPKVVEPKPKEESKQETKPVKPSSKEANEVMIQTKPVTVGITAPEYKETVNKVSEALATDKISKADSEKIAKNTKNIVDEYNKKIQRASTTDEKNKLAKEASRKINDTIKTTSATAYEIINNEDNATIYDQKDEKIVLKIDATTTKKKDSKDKEIKETKSAALTKSPKLAQEPEGNNIMPILIVVLILVVIAISIGLILVLNKRESEKHVV